MKPASKTEFAAMVTGTHPDTRKYREYVLAELRCARRRAQLLVLEIETIGVALRGNIIEPDCALDWLAEANALDFLQPTEPEMKYEPGTEPKEDGRLHRYAPLAEAMDYVRLGWLPLPSLRGTNHENYSVHLIWLCDCAPAEPTEDNIDVAIARSRLAEINKFPERLVSGAELKARLGDAGKNLAQSPIN